MLTDDVLNYIDLSVLCWLATANDQGVPNVSPKETFAAHGRTHLLIANIASPKSVRNIRVNPHICVSFVDVFVEKGYKLRGEAEVISSQDSRYDDLQRPLVEITKGAFPIRSIILVEVTAVEPIVAPSYHFRPDATEATQMLAAMRSYGVASLVRGPDRSRKVRSIEDVGGAESGLA